MLNTLKTLTWKQYVAWICFYILPILAFAAALFGGWDVSVAMGKLAIMVFFVVLLSRPLAAYFPKIKFLRVLSRLRRELGVLSFWLVVAHMVGILYALEIFSWEALKPLLAFDNLYLWGFLGAVGMLYLGLTSNTLAVKLLKDKWKPSHTWVVYPTMIFSVIHVIMAGEGFFWIILTVLYLGLKLGLYFKHR